MDVSNSFLEKLKTALVWMLAVGLFVQISGKIWIESGSARNAQIYIFLLLPALVFILYGLVSKTFAKPSVYYLPWCFFLFWVGISAFWASGLDKTPFSFAKRGFMVALYLAAISIFMFFNQKLLRKVIFLGVVCVAVGALVSLVYQFGFLDRPLAYRAYRIDRSGIGDFANFGWPVAAGIFHGAVAIWALGAALDRNTTPKYFAFWITVFSVLSVYVFFTYTRGAWFSLLGGGVAVAVLQNSRRGWVLMAVCAIISLAMAVVFWDQLADEFGDKKLSGRGFIWIYYFNVMTGHWIFGHGLGTPFEFHWPESSAISPHAHSLYLQQIYDSGIISLALLGAGLLAVVHKAWKLRSNYWVRLAFPALVFALIAMLTDVERVFTRPGDYWTLFWLPVAILLAVPMRSKQADQVAPSS